MYANHLLADNSHVISSLILFLKQKPIPKMLSAANFDGAFRVK